MCRTLWKPAAALGTTSAVLPAHAQVNNPMDRDASLLLSQTHYILYAPSPSPPPYTTPPAILVLLRHFRAHLQDQKVRRCVVAGAGAVAVTPRGGGKEGHNGANKSPQQENVCQPCPSSWNTLVCLHPPPKTNTPFCSCVLLHMPSSPPRLYAACCAPSTHCLASPLCIPPPPSAVAIHPSAVTPHTLPLPGCTSYNGRDVLWGKRLLFMDACMHAARISCSHEQQLHMPLPHNPSPNRTQQPSTTAAAGHLRPPPPPPRLEPPTPPPQKKNPHDFL